MNRLLGLCIRRGTEVYLLQADSSFVLSRHGAPDADPGLLSVLRGRDERVGTGRSAGEGVFDFRYGPFTGGLGETGLLHLSTYGERILAVDIDLSLKHRAIESSLAGVELSRAPSIAQTVGGNFAFAHQEAFARAVEAALDIEPDEASRRLSLIALELERIYNHLLVITRLAEAAAQRVLAAHLGALFEEALRTNRAFCGSRFLWGTRRVGGMNAPFPMELETVDRRIGEMRDRFARLYDASLTNRNYLDRLHGIAVVDAGSGRRRSLSGPSVRATGVADDLRCAEPLFAAFSPTVHGEGDSLARMEVRADEILQSCELVIEQMATIKASQVLRRGVSRLTAANSLEDGRKGMHRPGRGEGVGAVEGASGLVVWAVEIEGDRVASATASTPSLFGYQVFAEAFSGHIFTDFPFALDSFGLSFADAAR